VLVTGQDVLVETAGGESVSNKNASSTSNNSSSKSSSSSGSGGSSSLRNTGDGSATIFCLLEDTLASPGDDTRVTPSDVEVTVVLVPAQQASKGQALSNNNSSSNSGGKDVGAGSRNTQGDSSSSRGGGPTRRPLLWRAKRKVMKRLQAALECFGL
jgi:hypothetical protein